MCKAREVGSRETHRVAETSPGDLDADLASLWRSDFDRLERERLARFPGHSGLASDGLSGGGRHLQRRLSVTSLSLEGDKDRGERQESQGRILHRNEAANV